MATLATGVVATLIVCSRLSVKRNCPPRLVPHPIGRAKTIADAAAGRSGVSGHTIGVIKANSDGQHESTHTSTWLGSVQCIFSIHATLYTH